jgi:sigma-B regulation protein RsbQ
MPDPTSAAQVRNNVQVSGDPDGTPIVFGHGFGGSRESWRFVAPEFEADHRVVVFDHTGAGNSDISFYDRAKYDSLHGYADDIIEIIEDLGLRDVIFVGHSVGGIIGMLAANRRPDLFGRLILLVPSPRYIDTPGYTGGFTQEAVDELLDSLDANYSRWSSAMAPVLMGNPDRPELSEALAQVIAAVDPTITAQFAAVTFLSDNRRDLAEVSIPTLILASTEDNVAGPDVERYVHENIPGSRFITMNSRGHVPNLSAPDEVVRHIREELA